MIGPPSAASGGEGRLRAGLWLASPFAAYAAYSALRGDLRVEHLLVLGIVVVLASVGPRSKELLGGLYPLGLVFILYDGMRPFQTWGLTESRVMLCDLRSVEVQLFGVGGGTLHDYFRAHHTLALDLACAVPYATFVLWCVGGAFYLYRVDRASMKRFMWGFLMLNVAGFATYHIVPAAPPWYFHEHGCVVDLATHASEGPALARVDAFLGVRYFHGMYGKASSVFGALPSLHCAYPLLLVVEGWRAFTPRMRVASVVYYAAMVFSAIYLDHHWVIDALLGSAFALVVAGMLRLRDDVKGTRPASNSGERRAVTPKTYVAYTLATWFGCGYSPVAPGTAGTLGALPLYLLVRGGGPMAVLAAAVVVTVVGIWSGGVVADHSGKHDPQLVVIDEVAGVLLALAVAPPTLAGAATAVVLFRVFDITKLWPARRAERLPRGWGIVVDDIVAGVWAAAGVLVLRAAGVLS
jgi:inositol phosphorylceramide synthase catalytic subunit